MLLLHLLGIAAISTAVALGLWQLDSWQESRIDRAAEIAELDPVPVGELIGADDPFPRDGVGRPVTMAGQWLPESSVLISDRLHDDELGAWLVTPLAVCEDDASSGCANASAMPVVVGWLPSTGAPHEPPTGSAEVTGWLQPPESSGEPDPDPSDDVLTAVRIPELLPRVDRDLYGAYVILDEPAAARDGLVAVTPDFWPDPPPLSGLRNFLYGLEWWVFAGFAAFLWYRWARDEVLSARAGAHPDEPDPDVPDPDRPGGPDGPAESDPAQSDPAQSDPAPDSKVVRT